MKNYLKLLFIPVCLMFTNCTSSGNNAESQSGSDSTTVDSTATGMPTQDPIKADTPITNGQRSNSGDKH